MTDKPSHLFVVGPSRSGTAKTRSVLNAHPEIFIAGETHWFDDLRTRIPNPADPIDREIQSQVEDYFLALSHRPFGHNGDPDAGWLDRTTLRQSAQDLDGSADAYFDAFIALVAQRSGGASIIGEKTPRHVFRIDEILERFDSARVLLMVRDPLAVVASYKDWNSRLKSVDGQEADRTRRSYAPTLLSALWQAQIRAGNRAARRYPDSVMIQRYEDLVTCPEPAVRAISEFVGVGFVPEMLHLPLHNSSYSAAQWEAGISSAPVDRWKKHLTPAEVGVVELVTRRETTRHGYDRFDGKRHPLGTTGLMVRAPFRITRAVVSNRGRMGNTASYVAKRVRALIGG